MTVKYATFADVKALDKAIASVVRKSATLRTEIQIVAVGILQHAHKHGDWTRAQSLVEQLGAGVRGKALVDWFCEFGGLLIGGAGAEKGFIGWQGADYIASRFDDAKGKMWWECKPESPFAGFNLDKELDKLIKRAEASMKEANKLRHAGNDEDAALVVVSVDKLAQLRALKSA